MNWRSDEGRALLWRAWPLGYLPMRGVHTLGGWTCIRVDLHPKGYAVVVFVDAGNEHRLLLHRDGSTDHALEGSGNSPQPVEVMKSERRRGNYLPRADPTDHATWACCKADLAAACDVMGTEVSWHLAMRDGAPVWWLVGHVGNRTNHGQQFSDLDTDDPAEALVRARLLLRGGSEAQR